MYVQYPYALDPVRGVLVDVEDAERGGRQGLICTDRKCASPMVAVQSQTGKVQWHFRHAHLKSCRYLHDTTLELLEGLLREAIAASQDVRFQYDCKSCRLKHTKLLLSWDGRFVARVKRERKTIEGHAVMPDLTLQDERVQPVALVEVVDTHQPEAAVIETGLPILQKKVSPPFLHALHEHGLREILDIEIVHNIPCPLPKPAPVRTDPARTREESDLMPDTPPGLTPGSVDFSMPEFSDAEAEALEKRLGRGWRHREHIRRLKGWSYEEEELRWRGATR